MIINSENNTSIVTLEGVFSDSFPSKLNESYNKLSHNNIIVNLLGVDNLGVEDILTFHAMSSNHRENKLSFVIAASNISYEDLPEDLIVVPTLLEANDIIDMEEMERDLGLDELDLD